MILENLLQNRAIGNVRVVKNPAVSELPPPSNE